MSLNREGKTRKRQSRATPETAKETLRTMIQIRRNLGRPFEEIQYCR